MMQQYFEIKDQYQDYILFFRLGDFYEMFFEDAQVVSRELELTLTGRDCGEGRAPMCGVPYHSCEPYIGRLIEKGYKIAICEQVEDPAAAKGIVRREVIRVVTPGTVIETELLSEGVNNYLCTVCSTDEGTGVCVADISTAYITATFIPTDKNGSRLLSEISTFAPREIILSDDISKFPTIAAYAKRHEGEFLVQSSPRMFSSPSAVRDVSERFTVPEGTKEPLVRAVSAILEYIRETQLRDPDFLRDLIIYQNSEHLEMDSSTRRNLELCETMLTGEKRGSLLWVLDKTRTSAGARMLRYRIEHPLTNAAKIIERQRSVSALLDAFMLREELILLLDQVLDLERLMTRVTYKTAGARELRAIAQTASVLPQIKSMLDDSDSEELRSLGSILDPLADIYDMIDTAIVESPPFQVREGDIIKDGYSAEVDELRSIIKDSKGWLQRIEEEEKEKTGLKNLKIGYNRVFGYYIELPRSASEMAPEGYIRKQTLSNSERYITEKLKEAESTILGASDKIKVIEYELFAAIRDKIAEFDSRVRQTASILAELDFFISLASAAASGGYVCPEINEGDVIDIKDGRHPVVEQFVKDSYFVPNDSLLDSRNNKLLLITGPNMAGKSTYMRQTALIILMAQIGSFVPASSATIGIVDKLFTRVGASDDLAAGQSTFMLEMKEVAHILANATKKSFIIYDEIGRGTSTYDGMSIARAVAEYTAGKAIGAKSMFATHYHELTELEDKFDGIVNYNVAAKKRGDDVTFLRKIVRGPADDSYGIEVAKLAGVPDKVIKRAKEILADLESGEIKIGKADTPQETPDENFSIFDTVTEDIKKEIQSTDINTLTPIEAMNLIYDWKRRLS
ncbi:MAG: DNA mismatch repair protein MutS [Clostridia bacterium]|nr:DNA mismatch repair protein MutS [Clostridia bacterium]